MCVNCDYTGLLSQIEDLQNDGEHDWADDTLTGIHDTVSSMEHCTDGQKTAVNNIANAGVR